MSAPKNVPAVITDVRLSSLDNEVAALRALLAHRPRPEPAPTHHGAPTAANADVAEAPDAGAHADASSPNPSA